MTTKSPCIGMCSTTYGDDVCKGCGRTFYEVHNWIRFNDEQKIEVNKRLEGKNDSKKGHNCGKCD